VRLGRRSPRGTQYDVYRKCAPVPMDVLNKSFSMLWTTVRDHVFKRIFRQ